MLAFLLLHHKLPQPYRQTVYTMLQFLWIRSLALINWILGLGFTAYAQGLGQNYVLIRSSTGEKDLLPTLSDCCSFPDTMWFMASCFIKVRERDSLAWWHYMIMWSQMWSHKPITFVIQYSERKSLILPILKGITQRCEYQGWRTWKHSKVCLLHICFGKGGRDITVFRRVSQKSQCHLQNYLTFL